MEQNKAGFFAGIAIVLSVVALLVAFTSGRGLGGSVIETVQTDFQNGLKVAGDLVFSTSNGEPTLTLGNSGSVVSKVIEGTCNPSTSLLPLEATSTDAFTCTVTGAVAGDQCHVTLPNYDLPFGGLFVAGCTASTDTITFSIMNDTGAATSSFPVATTSVSYRVEQ